MEQAGAGLEKIVAQSLRQAPPGEVTPLFQPGPWLLRVDGGGTHAGCQISEWRAERGSGRRQMEIRAARAGTKIFGTDQSLHHGGRAQD